MRNFSHRCCPSVSVDCSRLRHRVIALLQFLGIAVLVAAYPDAAVADSFGRLFFSAEERRTINDMREADTEPEVRDSGPRKSTPVAPVVDVISFDGKVERSDGGSTVWVNGRPVYTGNRTIEGIRVQPLRGTGSETRFILPPSDIGTTKFSLKVGQKVAVQNGRKFDVYEVRPGEDAESVLEEDDSGDPDAQSEKKNPPATLGKPAPPATSPGS